MSASETGRLLRRERPPNPQAQRPNTAGCRRTDDGRVTPMALGNYLAGEIAADFGDGLLTRREAVRRLGLLGLSVTSAGALLAACGSDNSTSREAKTTVASTT